MLIMVLDIVVVFVVILFFECINDDNNDNKYANKEKGDINS